MPLGLTGEEAEAEYILQIPPLFFFRFGDSPSA